MIPITKEVRPLLLVIGAVLIFAQIKFSFVTMWPYWLAYIILLFIFRDFHRQIPAIPLAVVSSVDGKIIKIEECQDPYLDRDANCVHIRQSPIGEFNVHSPVEGKLQNIWVTSPEDSSDVQFAMWLQTDEEDDVVMVTDLNSTLRHASCDVSAGEKLGQGQRCGVMAFMCEVVLYLPKSANIAVKLGQSVRAGSDKLAEFVRKNSS